MFSNIGFSLTHDLHVEQKAEDAQRSIHRHAKSSILDPAGRDTWVATMEHTLDFAHRTFNNQGDPWERGIERNFVQGASLLPLYQTGLISPWLLCAPFAGLAYDRGKIGYLNAEMASLERRKNTPATADDPKAKEALAHEGAILERCRGYTNTQMAIRIAGIGCAALSLCGYAAYCVYYKEEGDMDLLAWGAQWIGGATNLLTLAHHIWTGTNMQQINSMEARTMLEELAGGGEDPSMR